MKNNTTQVTKSDLLDYVTKFEFNEFRVEVRDFRESVESRFNAIDRRFDGVDRRFDSIDRRFDQLQEEFRTHTGVILQQTREYFDTVMEYMRNIEAKKMDKEVF